MSNLALTYRYQGRMVEAEKMFKNILAEWKETDSKRPFLALSVQNNLALIFAELRLQRFMKANRFRCDHMHERAALHAWENGRIDLLGKFLFAHDDAATRTAQTLVRRRGDKLRVRDRTGMLAARYQTCDVRHVDEQNRANRIRDLTQSRKIDDTRIS